MRHLLLTSVTILSAFARLHTASASTATSYTVTCAQNLPFTTTTTCLQNALNNPATIINFPKNAVYPINSGLWVMSAKTLVGNGTKIVLETPKTTGTNRILAINSPGVSVSGFTFEYVATQKPTFLVELRTGASNTVIQNNVLEGSAAGAAIYCEGKNVSNVQILANQIYGVGYGIEVNSVWGPGIAQSAYPANWKIDGNVIGDTAATSLSADGIEINTPVYGMPPDVASGDLGGSELPGRGATGFTISNNKVYASKSTGGNAGLCIGLAGVTKSTVTNNTLYSCKWQGVHIEDESNAIMIRDNLIEGTVGPEAGDVQPWAKADSAGIIVMRSQAVWMFGNQIEYTAGNGIEFAFTPTEYTEKCEISGNKIYKAGAYGIFVGGANRAPVDAYIGPVPAPAGGTAPADEGPNVTNTSALGSIKVSGSPTGTTVKGNTGN